MPHPAAGQPLIEKPWTGLDWSQAPVGFNWVAQDADGRWFWFCVPPLCGLDGGVWRSNSRQQQYAGSSTPSENWWQSLQTRPQA